MDTNSEEIPDPRDLRAVSEEERTELARTLYEKIGPRILELGYRYYAGKAGEAEELVAETFARVIVALCRFRGESSYSTWIYRIAMNVIADSLRRRPLAQLEAEPLSPFPSAEHAMEARERRVEIDAALQSLSPTHRMVLTLVAMKDMSSIDAAAFLGVPEGTLWSRYSRARLALARQLKKMGIEG